jgi:multiple RNA-binding domain-containing protein 1
LVCYELPGNARKAFKGLSYTKFKHVPLYLEWAPMGVISEGSGDKSKGDKDSEDVVSSKETKSSTIMDLDENNEDDEPSSSSSSSSGAPSISHTIFVKNLSFATTESDLSAFFAKFGTVRACKVPTKTAPLGSKNEGAILSNGYGFVEFGDAVTVKAALKGGNGRLLDGHLIECKLSDKGLVKVVGATKGKKSVAGGKDDKRTKLMVRNVPFEADRTELYQLFGNFGSLKKVTLPKKFDGTSRGFAFVDYLTNHEAQAGMKGLASSHLYGRHLIIEYAEDLEDIDTLREKAKRDVSGISGGSGGGGGQGKKQKKIEL